MRRPLLILAAASASIPLLTGAAFATTPTKPVIVKTVTAKVAAPHRTPALTMRALTAALNTGNGYAVLALDCAADRTAMLAVLDAADLNDRAYAISVEDSFTVTAASTYGVSPMSINENATEKNNVASGSTPYPYTLLLQNGQWCVSGDGNTISGYAELMRGNDTNLAHDAETRFIAAHPGSTGVAYSVDATKKATKVYLGSTNLWYLASKGTKTTVLTRPATDTAPASYCIATTKAAAFHPTWVSIYDSLQPGIHEGPALTC